MTSPDNVTTALLTDGVWTGNNDASINSWLASINAVQTELTATRGQRTVNGVTTNDVLVLTWDQPGGFNNGYTFNITTSWHCNKYVGLFLL